MWNKNERKGKVDQAKGRVMLALVYGGFTFKTETHQANIGPLDLDHR